MGAAWTMRVMDCLQTATNHAKLIPRLYVAIPYLVAVSHDGAGAITVFVRYSCGAKKRPGAAHDRSMRFRWRI